MLDVKTMDAEPFMEHIEYTEKVLENVQEQMIKAIASGDLEQEMQCKAYMKKYRDLSALKFDQITAGFSVHSDIMITEIEKRIEKDQKE